MKALVVVAVVGLLVACEPDVDRGGSPVTSETFAPPHPEGWDVSDARVWTRDDLAYWIVSYDGSWTGSGEPEREKCVFRVKNSEGVVVRQTGEILEEGDDIEAETIYPDEIPGRPTSVTVDCG